MDKASFESHYVVRPNTEWLDIECDILIPAAIENAIHVRNADNIKSRLIVEAANIPVSPEADEIIKDKGIDLVNDFVANIGSVRFYDAVIFGLIKPEPKAVLDDIEVLCRRNVQKLFSESMKSKRYQREVAHEIFKPPVSTFFGTNAN